MNEDTQQLFDEAVEATARVCHEANRAYCAGIGDRSQQSWEAAPEWQRESARNGVRHALENPGATPADSHLAWLAEKAGQGWSWGPEKRPDLKQHPCFVDYSALPESQRLKDKLFLAVVRALHS